MTDIEATKFYIRHRERYPETEMQAYALLGFLMFGVETEPFYWVDDIDRFKDLGPTVGIAGYIGDIERGLQVLGRPLPENLDYPIELVGYLGRNIRRMRLGDVRSRPSEQVFIKPAVEHKLFTGFVWEGDSLSRRRIVTLDDDVEIWVSDPVKFVAEYRTFILDGEVLDCRKYKGSYGLAPDRDTVEEAVRAMKGSGPRAYCLDFGVTAHGKSTLLIEYNDAFAMGHYGLTPTSYARMLSARWQEMVEHPKEKSQFNFQGITSGRFSCSQPNISSLPREESHDADADRSVRPPVGSGG